MKAESFQNAIGKKNLLGFSVRKYHFTLKQQNPHNKPITKKIIKNSKLKLRIKEIRLVNQLMKQFLKTR